MLDRHYQAKGASSSSISHINDLALRDSIHLAGRVRRLVPLIPRTSIGRVQRIRLFLIDDGKEAFHRDLRHSVGKQAAAILCLWKDAGQSSWPGFLVLRQNGTIQRCIIRCSKQYKVKYYSLNHKFSHAHILKFKSLKSSYSFISGLVVVISCLWELPDKLVLVA